MHRCTLNGVTFTFMPCLILGSKGYNNFYKVIGTKRTSSSFPCFAISCLVPPKLPEG